MRSIAIVVPTLVENDAIGNDVIAQQRSLAKRGFRVSIYAERYDRQFRHLVARPSDVAKTDILIYHHGNPWPRGEEILHQHKGPHKILRYHNVTPASFFRDYAREVADYVQRGRDQTQSLVQLCSHYFTDSCYNQSDLTAGGARSDRCIVIPPFTHVEEMLEVHADIGTMERMLRTGKRNVLFVGRRVPNKGVHHFVRVAHAFAAQYGRGVRFTWVGGEDPRLGAYYREIDGYVRAHRLGGIVNFAGRVNLSQLKAYYLTSDVFLSLTEHEGFCVPVVEAQAVGSPIVALGRAAVPETIGPDQLVLDEVDYNRFVASLYVLLRRTDFRLELAERGFTNYRTRFRNATVEEDLINAVEQVVRD